ncbi:MAG TPA: four helix bundle protein, partial [Dehalococcoidia bacterium]
VWQKAHRLALAIYEVTKDFPRDEIYGLTSQMRRCASSIPANVAEGCGTSSRADFARFLQMAMSSASELEYHLLLGRDLNYLDREAYQGLNAAVIEIKRMLPPFIGKLRSFGRGRSPPAED